jgi:hypothetical protein
MGQPMLDSRPLAQSTSSGGSLLQLPKSLL